MKTLRCVWHQTKIAPANGSTESELEIIPELIAEFAAAGLPIDPDEIRDLRESRNAPADRHEFLCALWRRAMQPMLEN